MLGVVALATLLLPYCAVETAAPPPRKASVKGTTSHLKGLGGTTGRLPGLQGETKYPPGLGGASGKLPGLQGETQYPPGLKGTAPSPQKPKTKYLCGDAYSCNFGSKRSCLLTDGIKSPVKCVKPSETCESVWTAYCVTPLIPICKDEITECLCSCGQKNGIFGWFL
uniref:Uncharacterized protein n=1 Tax=Rhipicephalus zambeziensis TaxID=60191 RepID=A0A224Y9P6_9ACAR